MSACETGLNWAESGGSSDPGGQHGRGCDTAVPVPQVRCAAVFALGTFVGNSAERTDHSTTIDHNVAMMLAQLINDGSPVVRKVRAPPSPGSALAPPP